MNSGNQHLTELLRTRIEKDPVSFAWFMEQALYHPEYGYYSSGRAKLGRRGDYFTNVSVGPVFGRLLAIQFAEIWQQLGSPDDFVIVEQGAGEGHFAHDGLGTLEVDFPECFDRIRYLIVEPFPILRERQANLLSKFCSRVNWCDSLDEVEPFVGIHFSNELLDALPVHVVRRRERTGGSGEEWMEKCVGLQNGRFEFVERSITDARVSDRLKTLSSLPAGFEVEVNLAALDWIDALSKKLRRGYALIIDYGFSSGELSAGRHQSGTLQCRSQHRMVNSPFEEIGQCDITAHVDWTAIAGSSREKSLRIAGFTDQHHFLTGIISTHPEFAGTKNARARRQLQTLLHPEMMGRSFQVLALSRGISGDDGLSGFKFAGDAARLLGLDQPDSI